ncbi:MAG: lactate racemase [Acidobacteriota bacterium]|jgi:nickel-dependent lactate racemase|nr:lactate racemase [Acidobacteriota bacterium]
MINLGYGHDAIPFDFDQARFRILDTESPGPRPLTDVEIGAAIDEPIDSAHLEEIVSVGESVLIVVSDATRASGSATIVNLLVRRLIESGLAPADIRIIFATGIHRAVTESEKRELLTPFIAQRINTLSHDAYDASNLIQLGKTARGTSIELNRAIKEHDHVILTGGIGFHYFAGFTGGRKSICPGLASARTIQATHMLALDPERGGRRAGVATGELAGNAVHEECERITEEVGPSFLINAVVDGRGRVTRVYAGNWRTAHARACAEYTDEHSTRIEENRGLVIASCGGAPWDINLIQAHKSLEMAAHACREGGDIILVAECSEGFGRSDFLKWFDAPDSRTLETRLRESYEVNGQTAWSLLVKTEKYRVHLISELKDDDVRKMRVIPSRSLDEALARIDPSSMGYIIAHASSLLPICEENQVRTVDC